MKVLISGCNGHMGKVLSDMVRQDTELTYACGVDKSGKTENAAEPVYKTFAEVDVEVDVIIDFSNHSLTSDMIEFATKKNIPTVIATTGQTEDEKNIIREATKKIPIFFAANYSIGIAVLIDAAKNVAAKFQNADIEIVETHHNRKLDAPSGTALKIADGIKEVRPDANFVLGRSGNKKREKNDIGINSIRLGNVVGVHEILISTEHECLSLKHEAYDRGLFAEGAIKAAKFLKGRKPGLYDMKYLLV